MYSIRKYEGTMTPRERVRKTFVCEKTDRVPIDYSANDEVHKRLAASLGIPNGDYELVLQALGVDFRGVYPIYKGPALFEDYKDTVTNPIYGYRMKYIKNESGGYWDFCEFPLKGAEPEVIANFPVPDPDDFDYDTALEMMKAYGDYAIYVGNAGLCDIINATGRVMGMEDALVNLALEDEATLTYIDRRSNMELRMIDRLLSKSKGRIDFLWMGEDLGTQHAPMISLGLYRTVLKPRHQKYIDLANSYGIPTMVHTCGSSSWVYEDFIQMGVKAVDALQPEAANMSPKYLTEHFGGRLAFHGCISTAGPLAYGTKEDIEKDVKDTLSHMMKSGGYFFSPTHMIQDNTPVENIIAMYQIAHDVGRYGI